MLQFTRLRLVGFKSFVEPTELAIEPGLTGVVGPNGCGKSNLVEALRWVMGESSAKALRGGEMEDVVFAGTAERPGRGFAEVVVALDNGARAAPPPFTDEAELNVTRRIDRGRGSTFRINGREVRARDVQLLFADHAAGARSAAMVTQGQVTQLIGAKPAERRALLEEAAGIGGLAARRHEAEGRLAAAEQNLARVEDVLTALDGQRSSLKEQAAQAARYRTLSAAIRKAEIALFRRQWRAAEAALAAAEAEARAAGDGVVALTAAAASAAARQADAAAAVPGLKQRAAAATEALFALIRQCDQLDAEDALLGRETADMQARCDQLGRELVREQALATEADAARDKLLHERERLIARGETDGERRAQLQAAIAALTDETRAAETEVAALDGRIARAEAERAALAGRLRSVNERLARLTRHDAALAGEEAAFAADGERNEDGDEGAARLAVDDALARLAAARQALAAAEQRRAAAQTAATAAREAAHVAATTLARGEAEERTLAGLIARARPAEGRPVLDDLAVPPDLAPAVAAAFGEDLLATLDGASTIHWRTLPPLDPTPLPAGMPTLAERVAAPPALARRLAATGLVDDGAAAERLLAQLGPGQRLVTHDGQLWRWDGFVQTSPPPGRAQVALEQRERLAAVAARLAEERAQRDTAAAAAAAASEAATTAEAAERAAKTAERQAEAAATSARDRLSRCAARAAQRAAKAEALAERRRQANDQLAEARAEAAAVTETCAQLPDLEVLRRESAPGRQRLAGLRDSLLEQRTAAAALQREAEGRRRRAEALAGEAADWQRRGEAAGGQIADIAARRREATQALEELKARPALLAARRTALEREREAAERARDRAADDLAGADGALATADGALRTAEAALAQARERAIRGEAARQQSLHERAQLALTIEDRLGVDAAALAAADASCDDDAAVDPRRLERMRRERDLMGAVNLRAEEEEAALAARIDSLVNDRADLEAAIGKLRRAIGEIDGESRQRLLDAFTDIDRHFRALFQRLFAGGRAELRLTEAEDPLAAGLDILASPPGKRLSLLSLLSGGEQTLAALALRFAVFLTRPAPVCVLDEVDAPLDDANVDRFCRLLDDLAATQGTRFLVITHHRLTMARMDRLYGVTMAEKGISRLLSIDLRRAEGLRQLA